jgi:hypothetical protein
MFDAGVEPLGSGSFGEVFLGTWQHVRVAIKKLRGLNPLSG